MYQRRFPSPVVNDQHQLADVLKAARHEHRSFRSVGTDRKRSGAAVSRERLTTVRRKLAALSSLFEHLCDLRRWKVPRRVEIG
jgi:hypothetical protein